MSTQTVSKTQHTPGPWVVFRPKDGTRKTYCLFNDPKSHSEAEANARLIAAAPDLLAALMELIAAVDSNNCEAAGTSRWPEVHAAIAKATE